LISLFGGPGTRSGLGKDINKTVARELAAERSKILRAEAGIGGKKRKDITFEKASGISEVGSGEQEGMDSRFLHPLLPAAAKSFGGKKLSEIHPFLIEKHK